MFVSWYSHITKAIRIVKDEVNTAVSTKPTLESLASMPREMCS